MITETLKKEIITKFYGQDSILLIHFMSNNEVDYQLAHLEGPLAIATLDAVYIDVEKLFYYHGGDTKRILFLVLHETCHAKRIKNFGKKVILEKLSTDNYEDYVNHIIEEEIIADRYARLAYYKLTNKTFPIELTQQLELEAKREKYKNRERMGYLFGRINNNEDNYKQTINELIKKIL